jgi:hypothetical protein
VFSLPAVAMETSGCSTAAPAESFDAAGAGCRIPPAPAPSATNGLWLYTWREQGRWRYALMPRRDSLPTASDVTAAAVGSLDELRSHLSAYPADLPVSWNRTPVPGLRLRLPPPPVAREIERSFARARLALKAPRAP